MNKTDIKKNKLEFNTYCIFTKDKQNIEETIGLVFKDYIEKINDYKNSLS